MTDDDSESGGDPFVWDEPSTTDPAAERRDAESTDEDSDGGDDAFLWEEPAEEATTPSASSGDDRDAPLDGLADEIRRRRGANPDGEAGREGGASDRSRPDARTGTGDSLGDPSRVGGTASERNANAVDVTERQADPDAPLGRLADEVRKRRADRDESPGTEDAFTRMEYREIESDHLWDSLDAEESGGVAGGESAGPDRGTATPVEERDVRIIPKRTCETCPHFAEPPLVACNHEGTEILELVGVDRHRVVDCPMAAEDRHLSDDSG